MTWDGLTPPYRTIVADPPWPYESRVIEWNHDAPMPYSTMPVSDIAALPVADIAEADKWHVNGARGGCNLFLWTTSLYLEQSFEIMRGWRFTPSTVLVWCKPQIPGGVGGTFKSNIEFVVVGRRGSPPAARGSSGTRWFQWPRGRHSAKPQAFFDLVEQVSVGPYVELFARAPRLGWDSWGYGYELAPASSDKQQETP